MDDDQENKAAFAVELLKNPKNPFQAALAVFPADTGRALWISAHWVKDPVVLAEQERLNSELGEVSFLPSKADLSRLIWDRAQSERTTHDDFVKLARLYADVRGFIPKADTNVNVAVVTNKVMVVKDLGSNEEWEAKAERQQRELVNVSTSRH